MLSLFMCDAPSRPFVPVVSAHGRASPGTGVASNCGVLSACQPVCRFRLPRSSLLVASVATNGPRAAARAHSHFTDFAALVPSASGSSSGSGLGSGAIIGIAVGGVALAVLLAALLIVRSRAGTKRLTGSSSRDEQGEVETTTLSPDKQRV